MFGSIKRFKRSIGMTDFSVMQERREKNEPKDRRAIFIIMIMLAVVIVVTVIRATYDPVTQAQLRNLKVSALDIAMFIAAVTGYFVIKRRGKK